MVFFQRLDKMDTLKFDNILNHLHFSSMYHLLNPVLLLVFNSYIDLLHVIQEQFVKENFETDAFTPLPIDKFHQQMATLERAADVIDPSNLPFSPRLSLSSRFLSRSQFGIR